MINTFEKKLKLPFLFNLDIDETIFKTVPYQIDSTSPLISWLASINCEIARSGAELFYIPPSHTIPVHADGKHQDNKVKLNFQYRGNESTMKWYTPTASVAIETDNPMQLGPYALIKETDAVLVHTAKIGQPSLVNAGVFHSVENGTDHRWTVSIPIWNLDTMSNLQWADAVDKFQPWLL